MPSIKFKYWTDSNIQLENFSLLIIVKWFLLSFLLRNITHFLIILKPSLYPMDLLEDGITCVGNETGVLGPYIDRYISFSDTSPFLNPSLLFCNISILLKSFSTGRPSQCLLKSECWKIFNLLKWKYLLSSFKNGSRDW